MSTPHLAPHDVAIVGAGPRALSVLERIVANHGLIPDGHRLRVHLIDPYAAGPGRIWRAEQSPLLWMNSMARDVTLYSDETVVMDGPVRNGPSLWEWIEHSGRERDDAIGAEARAAESTTFPTRTLQSEYLAHVLHDVLCELPPTVEVVLHRTRVLDVVAGPRERVLLEDGSELEADAVVLAQGHLDVEPTPLEVEHAAFAARHGLGYVGTGYTADLDLDALAPGQTTLVRGLGLAFVDLVVLLTEGRGGRYVEGPEGLAYIASGREPHLVAGSRRGVPYRSKLGYLHPGVPVGLPRFVTADAVRARTGGGPVTSFHEQVWPLVVQDLAHAHYAELFASHPERTSTTWDEFSAAFSSYAWGATELDALVESAVPKREDRFDLDALDRPLSDVRVASIVDLQGTLRDHIRADFDRRHDPYFSADSAVFTALLYAYGAIAGLAAQGLLPPHVVATDVDRVWHNFFSYVASGPPGPRLEQFVALSRAGVITWLGADIEVDAREELGVFVGRSSSHAEVVHATAFVEARLPDPSVVRSADPLVQALVARGELTDSVDDSGEPYASGKVQTAPADQRLLRADGTVTPNRFAVGPWVTGGAAAAAFARPRIGAGFFRQNDVVARAVIEAATGATP